MKKRNISIPTELRDRIKEMWQDDEGFWAAAAPGWCFDTLDGYRLCAESEEDLLSGLHRLRPEEYEVRDMTGERMNTISYGQACKLLPGLRLGYSLISTSTGENFERIQPAVYRRPQHFAVLEQEDGTKIYSLAEYSLTVREEVGKGGRIRLTPVDGAVAYVSKSWQELPEDGLRAACVSLELQLGRDAEVKKNGALPLIRVTGDRNEPFVSALLDLLAVDEKKLAGLIEVIPFDGYALSIQEVATYRPPYLKAIDDISQLLQNNGYEDASRFLDCAYGL